MSAQQRSISRSWFAIIVATFVAQQRWSFTLSEPERAR
jgi:hypothetical protein